MKRMLLILLVCGAMSGAVFAQFQGTLDPGDDALTIAEKIVNIGWNQGGGACRIFSDPGGDVVILQVDQQCEIRTPLRRIDHTIKVLTPDGKLDAEHCFSFSVECDELTGLLVTSVDFEPLPSDCDTPMTCPPGGACEFVFDEISVSTVESPVLTIPLLGTVGMIAMSIGLLGIGFFILRRSFAI